MDGESGRFLKRERKGSAHDANRAFVLRPSDDKPESVFPFKCCLEIGFPHMRSRTRRLLPH